MSSRRDETTERAPGPSVRRQRLQLDASPVSVLDALRDEPGLFGLVGTWAGADAVIGWRPVRRLPEQDDPFAAVATVPALEGEGAFGGGWVGAFGYRLAHRIESLPPDPPRPIPTPESSLAYYDQVLVLIRGEWWLEQLTADTGSESIEAERRRIEDLLSAARISRADYACGLFEPVPGDVGHAAAVQSTLAHLAAGDIYQANICRRLEASFDGDPLDLFCQALDRLTPRYAAFLRTETGAIASLSPELFLRRRGRSVRTSPIKGTAPLDSNVDELVASAKNRAENVMIVDLMRNDLGRVCVPGSVRVNDIARAEAHTGVWHLVSDVVGELAPGKDDGDLMRAAFPPGSVTGAPKVRAMQIITELEATAREAYTGAIGYVSVRAGLELNVAIRTFEFAAGRVWLGVGGGVVIDSTPEGELAETMTKARPLLDAIGAHVAPGRAVDAAAPVAGPSATFRPKSALGPPVDLDHGLFTTVLVLDGEPVDLDAHLERLATSADALYGQPPPSDLVTEVRQRTAGLLGRHRARIALSPIGERFQSTISVSAANAVLGDQLRLVPVQIPAGLGPHKYADRRRLDELDQTGPADSLLLVDEDGSLLETGTGNLFLVMENVVVTPALDGRLLPGVTRQRAVDELRAAAIPVREVQVDVEYLRNAREIFVTGSLVRVRSVGAVDQVGEYPDGPLTRWLRERLTSGTARQTSPSRAGRHPTRLLLIDNYDSFVYNLYQLLGELGVTTDVVRNDSLSLAEVADLVDQGRYNGIVISPGPGTPADGGVSTDVVRRLGATIPLLGVCLGHQCIAEAYGGRIVAAPAILHGKQSIVYHQEQGLFRNLGAPVVVARYHSLVVDESTLPAELEVTARTADGSVMGIRHRHHPVEGVQFHPESILTERGRHLLANFIADCTAVEPAALR